ncbi:MAG: aldehyde dehydrogenase [Acidobacteria bacterium]|nr:MAG: aldehyde dehydrogenase [Acidobacteriota bacterium]
MAEPKSYRNFIDGEWVECAARETFEDRNPADRSEVIGTFQRSSQADVEAAVEAARRAHRRWRQVPAPKRAESLFRMGEILLKRKEEYAREMTRDMGKTLKEARGDVQEAIDVCYYIAGEGRRMFGFTTPSELPNKSCSSLRMPVGVCGLITPWNFPMAIPSWKLIPALVCGNTVVIKPASDAPLSCYHLVKVCQEVGIPRGVVNYVTGGGEAVGAPLTRHPGVSLVSFTGSSETSRQVNLACADSYKRVSLEMGGKNAMIVLDDARLDLAVDGALWGAFATTGQRCTATSRIIVHKKVHKEFVDRLVERASVLKVFAGVTRAMRIAREEIFGPVVCILAADSLDDALEIANDTLYGLSSSIYTQDLNKAFVAVRELETGITYVNSSTIGAETHLPFGGTRRSGNGHREGAAHTAIEVFSEWKTVYVDYSGKLQKAQIDNN